MFVFMFDKVLVAGVLVNPPGMLPASLVLELVDWVPVGLLGVF